MVAPIGVTTEATMITTDALDRTDRPPTTPPKPRSPTSARVTRLGARVVVVAARGEIDLVTAPVLRSALALVAQDPAIRLLVCDLGEVTFLDCPGLSVLLEIQAQLTSRGAHLRVVTGESPVLRVLTVAELSDTLGVCADVSTAVSHHSRTPNVDAE